MKKILGILLAICCLGSAFAVKPSANMSVANFDGEAGIKYIQKLDYNEKTNDFGLRNWANAKIKINLLDSGLEQTKGKGIWGEIAVNVGSSDTGDKVNGTFELEKDSPKSDTIGTLKIGSSAEITTAKIHFYKGDVSVALNFLPQKADKGAEAILGLASLPSAVPGSYGTSKINKAYKNGFAIEIRNYLADIDLIYNSNGVQKKDDLKQSFVAKSTLKGFINTNIYADVAYTDKDLSYRLGADYNQAITDKLYVKPAVDFTLEERGDFKVSKLVAGALLGWGNKDQNPGFELDGTDKAEFNEGISFGYETTLSKHDFASGDYGKILLGVFDNSLVEGLATAVKYEAKVQEFAKGDLALNARYSKDFDVVGVTVEGEAVVAAAKFDSTDLGYSVCLWNNNVIKNTSLWAKYSGKTTVNGSANTGDIEIGAKIHF